MGIWTKILSALAAVLAVAKTINEAAGLNIFKYLNSGIGEIALKAAIGGVLVGTVLNFIFSLQIMRLLKAFDDLKAITVAYRGAPTHCTMSLKPTFGQSANQSGYIAVTFLLSQNWEQPN
jgi:hypothetical protein